MKAQFTLERRRNLDGEWCIAPFINGFNTGDIPSSQWTPAVARSIRRAYEIGFEEARRRMMQEIRIPDRGEWEEVK